MTGAEVAEVGQELGVCRKQMISGLGPEPNFLDLSHVGKAEGVGWKTLNGFKLRYLLPLVTL